MTLNYALNYVLNHALSYALNYALNYALTGLCEGESGGIVRAHHCELHNGP